jgi:predicted hydrolase (HD superfamily)
MRLDGNIMGNGLTVKHEVRLTRDDTELLRRIAKAKRCSLASLIRESVMEWLARRSFLQDEEKKALGVTTV